MLYHQGRNSCPFRAYLSVNPPQRYVWVFIQGLCGLSGYSREVIPGSIACFLQMNPDHVKFSTITSESCNIEELLFGATFFLKVGPGGGLGSAGPLCPFPPTVFLYIPCQPFAIFNIFPVRSAEPNFTLKLALKKVGPPNPPFKKIPDCRGVVQSRGGHRHLLCFF